MKKTLVWAFCCVLNPVILNAASCELATTVPQNAKQQADGVVTSEPFSAEFTGGQVAYLKIRNDTVHLTPVTVTFKDGKTSNAYCESTLAIPPQTTRIFKMAVFGERIYWGVRVAAGDVDVAQLSVNAYSIPPDK